MAMTSLMSLGIIYNNQLKWFNVLLKKKANVKSIVLLVSGAYLKPQMFCGFYTYSTIFQ